MSESLQDIAQRMVATGKGILAADESTGSIKKRLESIGVESTPDSRRDYREMLFRAEAMRDSISGVILFDETLRQERSGRHTAAQADRRCRSRDRDQVDTGAVPLPGFPGETITEGLDGLGKRIAEYHELGARFAKWRGVIAISNGLPTWGAVRSNAHALARYSAICQAGGIVPIVEPEVVMDGVPGDHSIERCQEVTRWVLETVFAELKEARVDLTGIILKPNMIIDGKHARKASVGEVAERTVKLLKTVVPSTVPGIACLSLRTVNRRGNSAFVGHECHGSIAVEVDILLWPRPPGLRTESMGRKTGKCRRRSARLYAPGQNEQPCCHRHLGCGLEKAA